MNINTDFDNYTETFVQRAPRYSVKFKNRWLSKNKHLSDLVVQSHLAHKYEVGILGRWYPEYGVIDADSYPLDELEKVRDILGMDTSNSMLFQSESPDSYHLIFRPTYRGNPPTLKLLQDVFKTFTRSHNLEIKPEKNRTFRLPFGRYSTPLDYKYSALLDWQSKLYWFQKLDDFDMLVVPQHQTPLDFVVKNNIVLPKGSKLEEGIYLYENGLQAPSTRHNAQFAIIYAMWRNNVPREEVKCRLWFWIKKKHNGLSKDFAKYPNNVKREIAAQVDHVFNNYDIRHIYPDTTHNTHKGYISMADVQPIIQATGGSLPRSRYLFELVKYAYPRRHRNTIHVHSDKLLDWGGWRTYVKYLNEFEAKGICKRKNGYSPGRFSKGLELIWNFKPKSDAVIYEGRSINTLEETLKLKYHPADVRDMVKSAGASRSQASYFASQIFNPNMSRNGETYN
jgi:hypothetical protein